MDCHDKTIMGHSEIEEPVSFGELYAKAPNMMVCFKRARDRTSGSVSTKTAKHRTGEKRAKSRELRASILYVGCDCEKRNGLQDQCPRSECQGRPPCLTKPPTCPPSEFGNAKHLTRKTDLFLKRKRDAEKAKLAEAAKETLAAKQAQERQGRETQFQERLHYDCIPIDQLVNEGDLCPVCTKPLDFVEIRYRKPVINMESTRKYIKEEDCCDFEGPQTLDFVNVRSKKPLINTKNTRKYSEEEDCCDFQSPETLDFVRSKKPVINTKNTRKYTEEEDCCDFESPQTLDFVRSKKPVINTESTRKYTKEEDCCD